MDERNRNEEIRRKRLRDLIAEEGGHAKFVENHNLSPSQASYLSQIVNGYSFGEKSAEKWRLLLKLPAGFFDVSTLTLKETDQKETLTAEQKQMLSFMNNLDKEAQDALLKMGSILSKNASAIKKMEEKPYSGSERRLGEDDRRKTNLGFDPERRHFYSAPNFPQKLIPITDRRRKEK